MKLLSLVVYGIIALISAAIFFYPHIYWDVIAYIGVIEFYKGASHELVHQNAYAALHAAVNEHTFEYLTAHNAYHTATFENSQYFVSQLPFYNVKPLYVALGAGLSAMGLDYVDSFVLISALAYFLTGILLYYWIVAITKNRLLSAAVILLTLLSPPILMSGRIPGPDMLAALTILAAVYLLLEKRLWFYSFLILTVSIAIRPDNIVFLCLILLYVYLTGRKYNAIRTKWLLTFFIMSVALYLTINMLSGNYGWFTLFYHSFIERLNDPAAFNEQFSLTAYFGGLAAAVKDYPYSFSSLPLYLLILCIAAYIFKRSEDHVLLLFAGVVVVNLMVKIVLFPDFDDRFYTAYYLLILILFIKAVVSLVKPAEHTVSYK